MVRAGLEGKDPQVDYPRRYIGHKDPVRDGSEPPEGIQISDEQMASVHVEPSEFHGDWSYTIWPAKGCGRPRSRWLFRCDSRGSSQDERRVPTSTPMRNHVMAARERMETSSRAPLLLLVAAACNGRTGNTDESGALDAGLGLRGCVISVRDHTVRISGGSRDGVREGDIFVVERIMVGYVGRIKITSVEKHYAVGIRIAGAGAPEPGDIATRDDATAEADDPATAN